MIRSLSLQTRLLILAIATILTTLILTALTIQRGVAESVGVMVDAKMDAQIEAFASRPAALERTPGTAAFLVDFRNGGSGWGWRVMRDGRIEQGGTRFGRAVKDRAFPDAHDGIVAATAVSTSGTPLRVRIRRGGGEVVEVAAPQRIMFVALRTSLYRAVSRVLLMALGLIAVAWLALSRVMRPLRRLRTAVAQVREGCTDAVPSDQPPELRPLAAEINNLLDQNAIGLANARSHVANLAHGLKTPLATLALRQVRDGASDEARAIVADLDQRIDHHLGRARVAAFRAGGAHTRTGMAEVVEKLIRALRHLHRERGIDFASSVGPTLVTAVDRQDLEEVAGNLLDNASRHARARVTVECERREQWLVLAIEDDGPGLSAPEAELVLKRGVRLGGDTTGRGLGLGICREIAEIYGGRLGLRPSRRGRGLRAEVTLPVA